MAGNKGVVMHYWNDGYNAWWWMMIPMMIVMLAVIGAVVWALVHASRTEPPATPKTPRPEEVLAQRLATGEIDTTEYRERLDALHDRAR
jgi:putative membrane protein